MKRKRGTSWNARGYSLPMVILLLAVLATATITAIVIQKASIDNTSTVVNRRQAFYACDGISRATMIRAREYMRSVATPNTSDLRTFVCGGALCPNRNDFAPAGYTVDRMTLTTAGTTTVAPLPNGPFRGMNARQNDLKVEVEATEVASGARCSVAQSVVLGEVALFQFFFFSDGYMDVFPAANMDINGRVHVNGDFCAAPYAGITLRFAKVTASGRIRATCANHSPSRVNHNTAASANLQYMSTPYTNTSIWGTASFLSMHNADLESGCTTCNGGATDWRAFAQSRWNGNVLDVEHQVPVLRLPFVGSARVQDGYEQPAAATDRVDNSRTMRALVDPIRPVDSADVREQKLMYKADIRIINGIWFKRDPANPAAIGLPIWSDHPRTYAASGEDATLLGAPLNVGQASLAVQHAWGATPPLRYSYYRHDGAVPGALLDPLAVGVPAVISYGTLHNAAGEYRPGYISGAASVEATTAAHLVAGAGDGFVDGRARVAGVGNILPMNFNVAAFAAALLDTGVGELGRHFQDGPDADTAPDFNGIVYIANTWPGSIDDATFGNVAGALDGVVPVWPAPTAGVLPFHLCTDGAAQLSAGPPIVNAPACGAVNRVSALRIINAQSISMDASPGQKLFPRGLSIVTNGPVYALGDTNTASTAAGQPPSVDLNGTWKPMMIAGDSLTLLSSNWNDYTNRWGEAVMPISAGSNTWNIAVIAGNVETEAGNTVPNLGGVGPWGGGLNNFARFVENWGGPGPPAPRIVTINGAFVNAFRSVYARQPYVPAGVFLPPQRIYNYDDKLSLPLNQPPGTPSFFVQAVQDWTRD